MISYLDELPTTTKSNNSKKVDSLPSSYTEIRRFLSPSTSLTFLKAPIPVLPDFDSVVHQQGVKEEYEWLESAYDDKTSYWVPWAKHHAEKHQSVVRLPDISAILPSIDEPVHTLDMQYHCMNIISNTINTLNPGQIPADTADQPIFALTKELIIRFPDKFGPDKYFCFFESLHIENSLLIICGWVIKGSELDEIMYTCRLSIVGADSLVTVNDIKRTRYCLQVGVCVIYSKLKQTHRDNGSDELYLLWLANKTKMNEMCFYWKLILERMIDVLVFIRFLREGKYPLILHRYVNSYAGTLLSIAITMLDGSQFTSMICWLYLKTRRNCISFLWMDISSSKKLIVSFRSWD